MKTIKPNVWQKRRELKDSDWKFFQCPADEMQDCLEWELHREHVQAEHKGGFPNRIEYSPTDDELRKFRLSDSSDEIPDLLRRLGIKPAGRYFKQTWPSYLEKRKAEQWRPITNPKPLSWEWLDTDWWGYFYVNWEELHDLVRTIPRRHLWIGGHDQTELCPLSIPWNHRDEEIIQFFREWLKMHRPTGKESDDRPAVLEPPQVPSKKRGAGAPIRQVKTKLKALAAWRLIQHHRGNHIRAFAHPGAATYLGRQFTHAGAWWEARWKVSETLDEFGIHLKFFRNSGRGRKMLTAALRS